MESFTGNGEQSIVKATKEVNDSLQKAWQVCSFWGEKKILQAIIDGNVIEATGSEMMTCSLSDISRK